MTLQNNYLTETRTLNQTVRRHIGKFPEDFMFQITKSEFENLKLQIVATKCNGRGGRQKPPLVFTELGVGMLSCVMDSNRAGQFSVLAIRAFAQARQVSNSGDMLAKRVTCLERDIQELMHGHRRIEDKLDAHSLALQGIQQCLMVLPISPEVKGSTIFAPKTTVDKIERTLRTVSRYFKIESKELKSTSRAKSIVVPRQIAIFIIRKQTGLSFKEIGKYFGDRDHTTILHAFNKISLEITRTNPIREAVEVIEGLLN